MPDQKVEFLELFRRYLYDYGKITARITEYQLSCFEMNKESNNEDGTLAMTLHVVMENTKKYFPFQKEIK